LRHFNPHNTSIESLRDDWNQSSRCPNLSDNKDGGWGLTQFTNPVPTSKALWNWKQNIDDAYWLLRHDVSNPPDSIGKSYYVKNKIKQDLDVVNDWNDNPANANNQVKLLDTTYAGIRWRYSIIPSFEKYSDIKDYFTQTEANEAERSFIDASIILAYNGYGGNELEDGRYVNFLYATRPEEGEKPKWKILDNQNDYVERICTSDLPK